MIGTKLQNVKTKPTNSYSKYNNNYRKVLENLKSIRNLKFKKKQQVFHEKALIKKKLKYP